MRRILRIFLVYGLTTFGLGALAGCCHFWRHHCCCYTPSADNPVVAAPGPGAAPRPTAALPGGDEKGMNEGR